MFKKSLFVAGFVGVVAGPAFADGVSPGAVMLANVNGVEPGTYTVSDLIRLDDAQRESVQASEVRFIKQNGTYTTRANTWDVGPVNSEGADQVAGASEAPKGVHSIDELIQISNAQRENDYRTENFYTSGTNRQTTDGDVGSVTPGKAQLAASLGVDPTQYTTSQLVSMQDFGGTD